MAQRLRREHRRSEPALAPTPNAQRLSPRQLIVKLTHMTYLLIVIAQSRPAGAHARLRLALRRNRAHGAGALFRRSVEARDAHATSFARIRCQDAPSIPGLPLPPLSSRPQASFAAPPRLFRSCCCCALGCSGTNITAVVNFVSARAPLAWFKATERRPSCQPPCGSHWQRSRLLCWPRRPGATVVGIRSTETQKPWSVNFLRRTEAPLRGRLAERVCRFAHSLNLLVRGLPAPPRVHRVPASQLSRMRV